MGWFSFFNPFEYSLLTLFALLLLVLLATLKYETSASFRYKFKFVFYVFCCSTVALIMIPLSLIRPRDSRNVFFGIPLIKPVSKILGLEWEIRGQEILSKDCPYVIVCNHQTVLDFMALVETWPYTIRCAPVAKREILYVFPFGFSAWLSGTIFIDRKNAQQSKSTINRKMESFQQSKTKMWIFPEGTRSKATELRPFKKGAFHIAVQNKLPILPVVISPYSFINDEAKIFNHGKVILQALPPIDTSEYGIEDVTKLSEKTRDLMNKEFHRLDEEVKRIPSQDVRGSSILNGIIDPIQNGKLHAS